MYVIIANKQDLDHWQGVVDACDLDAIRARFDENQLPDHMWQGVEDWIVYGRLPGGFLSGMLFNHGVREVIPRADWANKECLLGWVHFVLDLPNIVRQESWIGTEAVEDAIVQAGIEALSED